MNDKARVLIVNADDFGRSPGINEGVIRAREQGILTSAGLMVRWPAAAEAAAYAQRDPGFSLGLHVDLGEWVHENGRWETVYELVEFDDAGAIEREVREQLAGFRNLAGADPTHLDSHQHLHRSGGPLKRFMRALGTELGVPVRQLSEDVRYCGDFYGHDERHEPMPEAIMADNLIRLIRELRPGVTELGCHPGVGGDSESPYASERALELEALCDPRVRAAVVEEGVELRSFGDLP